MKQLQLLILLSCILVTSCTDQQLWDENTKEVNLEFRLVKESQSGDKLEFEEEVLISNIDIANAYAAFGIYGQCLIHLDMNKTGTKKLEDIIRENIGRRLAILVEGKAKTVAKIDKVFSEGRAIINNISSKEEGFNIAKGIMKQACLQRSKQTE